MSDATTEPLLQARGLEVRFNAPGGRIARAVDGVHLDLAPGEILALAGESGCGKTTLARTLLGLERPTAGTVSYQGSPLRYSTKALKTHRRAVQLVLQDPTGALNPRHTVYDAVAEGLRIHGIADNERERVADALSRAGLRPPEKFFLTYPHELSGGQRQRVVIAGALVLNPQVIIADEPVASLDASVRGEILALLLRLRDELGLAAIVVTHDLGLAWNIADRIAVMYLGRIVEQGTHEELLDAGGAYWRLYRDWAEQAAACLPSAYHAGIDILPELPDVAGLVGGERDEPLPPVVDTDQRCGLEPRVAVGLRVVAVAQVPGQEQHHEVFGVRMQTRACRSPRIRAPTERLIGVACGAHMQLDPGGVDPTEALGDQGAEHLGGGADAFVIADTHAAQRTRCPRRMTSMSFTRRRPCSLFV
jgi:ABC-type oligopeptide transport system ATPase subunit